MTGFERLASFLACLAAAALIAVGRALGMRVEDE